MADIPQWAIERAKALRDEGFSRGDKNITLTFASYIAENERPPLDPLLIEARVVVAEHYQSQDCPAYARDCLNGTTDNGDLVPIALAALRRGIELSSKGDTDRG